MIQTGGNGLLIHVQGIDWVKALVTYFIDKDNESTIWQGFAFTICPTVSLRYWWVCEYSCLLHRRPSALNQMWRVTIADAWQLLPLPSGICIAAVILSTIVASFYSYLLIWE